MNIQIHPDMVLLREECNALRQKLGDQIALRDKLLTTVKPNLEAQYQMLFGVLLLERLDLQFQTQRLRRKIELVRASINRDELPDLAEIEIKLDQEYVVWQEKIREMLKVNRWAEDHLSHTLSEADSRELHQLYRVLAKKIHPDLNPNLDDAKLELWHQVSRAYQMGDLETMKGLALIINNETFVLSEDHGYHELENMRDLFVEKNGQILKYIQDLEQIFPFSIRKQIHDPLWIQEQKDELNKQITVLKINLAYLTTIMDELFAESK